MKINKISNKYISNKKLLLMNSGDDSVLLDKGRIKTIQDVDKQLDKITMSPKEKLLGFVANMKAKFLGLGNKNEKV